MKLNLYPLFLIILGTLLSFALLFSCKSKKTTLERMKTSDTLVKTSLTYKTEPIESNYTIDLECDTITGKVKDVNFSETSGGNKAGVKIENNKLTALLEVGETTSKTDTIYKTKFKDVYKDKEVIRYRTALWHWFLHIILIIILFLYVRRYISFI